MCRIRLRSIELPDTGAPESSRSLMTCRDRALAAIHVTIVVDVMKIGIFPYFDFGAWRQTGTTTEPARLILHLLHCVDVASTVWRFRPAGITSLGTENLAWPCESRNQKEIPLAFTTHGSAQRIIYLGHAVLLASSLSLFLGALLRARPNLRPAPER